MTAIDWTAIATWVLAGLAIMCSPVAESRVLVYSGTPETSGRLRDGRRLVPVSAAPELA
jgi:hypothetical protein